MTIHVKFFAILRDLTGMTDLELEVPVGATVACARDALLEQIPALHDRLKPVAFAVNRTYATTATALHDGDELALLPPVSGG